MGVTVKGPVKNSQFRSTLQYRVCVMLSGGQYGVDVTWFISSAAFACTEATLFPATMEKGHRC